LTADHTEQGRIDRSRAIAAAAAVKDRFLARSSGSNRASRAQKSFDLRVTNGF
jgi:hypothetical protein